PRYCGAATGGLFAAPHCRRAPRQVGSALDPRTESSPRRRLPEWRHGGTAWRRLFKRNVCFYLPRERGIRSIYSAFSLLLSNFAWGCLRSWGRRATSTAHRKEMSIRLTRGAEVTGRRYQSATF